MKQRRDEALDEVLEIVRYIKDTSVTRKELHKEIRGLRNEMIDHIDGFMKLHQNHEAELSAMRLAIRRLESRGAGA